MKITADTMKIIIVSEAMLKFKIKILTEQLINYSFIEFQKIMNEFDEILSKLDLLKKKSQIQEIDYDLEIKKIFEAVASSQAKQSIENEIDCNAFINQKFEEAV